MEKVEHSPIVEGANMILRYLMLKTPGSDVLATQRNDFYQCVVQTQIKYT